jgi:Xaa-Pro aminopeptidase
LTVVPDPRRQRRARLLSLAVEQKADAIAITHLPNVRYLCGFTGSNALLLLTARGATLYTDPRYTIQASQECDCVVKVAKGPLWTDAVKEIGRRKVRRLAVEGDRLSHDSWLRVASLLGKSVKLQSTQGLTEELRLVKSGEEVEAIRRSVKLNSQAFQQAIRKAKPGMRENELAAEIDYRMRRLGAEGPAFETIVACGARTAWPHARPTAQVMERGQLLLVDMGACLDGYMSDMTRVAHLGEPSAKSREIYEAVLEAQLAAVAAVRAGVTCGSVDTAARSCLKQRRLDLFFTHSTGHGLGLEIHEGPRVGANGGALLQAGMVITIEPGVYVEGVGGVRIEDTVLVTETGVEVLTPTKKELLVLAS